MATRLPLDKDQMVLYTGVKLGGVMTTTQHVEQSDGLVYEQNSEIPSLTEVILSSTTWASSTKRTNEPEGLGLIELERLNGNRTISLGQQPSHQSSGLFCRESREGVTHKPKWERAER